MAETLSLKKNSGAEKESMLPEKWLESEEQRKQKMRYELVKAAIGGLALHQLDNPGRQARNAIALADACMAELKLNG